MPPPGFPCRSWPAATYKVTELATRTEGRISGRELMDGSVEVRVATRPGSTILFYEKE